MAGKRRKARDGRTAALEVLVTLLVLSLGCNHCGGSARPGAPAPEGSPAARSEAGAGVPPGRAAGEPGPDPHAGPRRLMVERQLAGRDIADRRVLAAMGRVPRHLFVPGHLRGQAYADHPLPIGHEQTISQPYVVAFMTQALGLEGDERVLEIGTGSGYQAAVLAELAHEVYTIEIVPALAEVAAARLSELGYGNVHVRAGDGYRGWPEHAPFDAIMVTAAPDHVPAPLVEQLAPSGRMIVPVGRPTQELVVIERGPDGLTERRVMPVRFVPMTGEAERPR